MVGSAAMDTLYRRLARGLTDYALPALAAAYVAAFLGVAALQIGYPFDLEWMEGGSLDHVRRVLAGQPLYVAPSLQFTPYGYPPLYYYLSAAVAAVTGLSFAPLRTVSVAAAVGSLVLIYRLVQRETGSALAGTSAAGLFAATYQASGAWLGLARVDSLALFLLLAAVYVLRVADSPYGGAGAGVLLWLSFLTKQTALVSAAPLVLYGLLTDRRRGVLLLGALGGLLVAGEVVLNGVSAGWFDYYVLDLPRQRLAARLVPSRLVYFWTRDIFAVLSVAGGLSLVYLLRPPAGGRSSGRLFYALLAAGMLGGAWVARLEAGAFDNALIPAYAALAVLFGLGLHAAREQARRLPAREQLVWRGLAGGVGVLQLLALFYDPRAVLPRPQDRRAGEALVRVLREVDGDVLVLSHTTLAAGAGKAVYAHGAALYDVWLAGREPARKWLVAELRQAIREQRFGAIVLDYRPGQCGPPVGLRSLCQMSWLGEDLVEYYDWAGPALATEDAFWSVTGARTRPEHVFVPKPQRRAAPSRTARAPIDTNSQLVM